MFCLLPDVWKLQAPKHVVFWLMYITYCEEILKLFLTCGLGVVEFLTVEISELENNVLFMWDLLNMLL